MSRIEAVHVRRRRREGGSECSLPLPARPHTPRLPSSQGEKTKAENQQKNVTRHPKETSYTDPTLQIIATENGLKITLKATNADNDSEKRSKRIFGRS